MVTLDVPLPRSVLDRFRRCAASERRTVQALARELLTVGVAALEEEIARTTRQRTAPEPPPTPRRQPAWAPGERRDSPFEVVWRPSRDARSLTGDYARKPTP